MTDDVRLTDSLLDEMFQRRARRVSAQGLRQDIVAAVGVLPRRHRVWDKVHPPLRLLAVAALLAAVAGGGMLVAGRQGVQVDTVAETPVSPAANTVSFVRPFTYRLSDEDMVGRPIREGALVGFAPGYSSIYPLTASRHLAPGAHGVAIGPISERVLLRCPSDRDLQPAGDVGVLEGFSVGGPQYRAIDGRKALIVWSIPAMRCVNEPEQWRPEDDVVPVWAGPGILPLYLPSRMYVTDVNGEPIVFQVWAASQEELDAWLPSALEFLDGIHFID
jgi:hypothetical protein